MRPLRKELLEQKLYRNAFVKFPAILMARKDGEDNYCKIEDFSNMDVSKLPVFVGKWSYLERSAKLILIIRLYGAKFVFFRNCHLIFFIFIILPTNNFCLLFFSSQMPSHNPIPLATDNAQRIKCLKPISENQSCLQCDTCIHYIHSSCMNNKKSKKQSISNNRQFTCDKCSQCPICVRK